MQRQPIAVIDHRRSNAANDLLPKPAVLSSSGWSDIHFELYQQPKFEIAEHQHTLHVIAQGLMPESREQSFGERWLDGRCQREARNNGDISVIPAGIAHRCNWHDSAQFAVLAIEPAFLRRVGQDWVDPDHIELVPRFMTEQDALIHGIFSTLKQEVESGGVAGDLLVDSLKTALGIHLLQTYCTTRPKLSSYANGLSQITLNRVTEYIQTHLEQDVKLVDLAAIAQLSVYHFLRLFKQCMGITPHQYILQCRIERAKHLLQHSELSIAEIAVRVGFCDQSHFTRCFKRMVGVTPKQLLHR
jgi:AraC family transcriptional regulator